ncbi:MAG: RIP metalloprotease RseP [Sporomusaceae bacterium]|nr:RIP metalloprotease RseP [Sporomusaceae bacterium]
MSITVIATVFVFGLLVFVHELGHFATAKWTGMRVDEFAIGFGKSIFSVRRGETLYSLRLIPLGGFNKIAGMDPDEEQDERSFQSKPIWARMLVIVAGSAMNFLLPVLLFAIVFFSAGIDKVSPEPVIGSVMAERPAERAGFLQGDRIQSVNGTTIATWSQFVAAVQGQAGQPLEITVVRDKATVTTKVVPEFDPKGNRGVIGVMPIIENQKVGIFEAMGLSVKQTYVVASGMLVGIGQMVSGQIAAEVAGPIGVAQMTGQVAQLGILPLLQFAAFLSINLGLINLFPVPVLDGGHIVTLAIEALRGKPLGRRSAQIVQMIGMVLLLMLMALATMKDIARLNLF